MRSQSTEQAHATFDNALSMMDHITTQHEKMAEHFENARRNRVSFHLAGGYGAAGVKLSGTGAPQPPRLRRAA